LSEASEKLREIEDRGIFTNYGPVNTDFERSLLANMFSGEGACVTSCNATIGLMLAVQQAIGERPTGRRYALMPSFTFAATAHAAIWCGLTPLFCEIDPVTWAPCPADEERLLAQYGDEIAVVMPYATFGYNMDLGRYEEMTRKHGVPVVVDAAASLGTIMDNGKGYGTGFSGTIVFSMHAVKSFGIGEGGLIYSADKERIAQLRAMSNFGFGEPRTATMLGLNGKLNEVGALMGLLKMETYPDVMAHRSSLIGRYRKNLTELTCQPEGRGRQAHQFMAGLLPRYAAQHRREIASGLADRGIGSAMYFSPHLTQQEYFIKHGVCRDLPVTDDVATRMISLPLCDTMSEAEVDFVAEAVRSELKRFAKPVSVLKPRPMIQPASPVGVPIAAIVTTPEPACAGSRRVL
jgi:dTDP-4-amino-4,6-dideoxygalactose transaminase